MIKIIYREPITIPKRDRVRITDFLDKYELEYTEQLGYTQEDIDYMLERIEPERMMAKDRHPPKVITPSCVALTRCAIIDYDRNVILTSIDYNKWFGEMRRLIPQKVRKLQREAYLLRAYELELAGEINNDS